MGRRKGEKRGRVGVMTYDLIKFSYVTRDGDD